ncbi:DUF3265 domain-containing protein [Vibrio vulnificus]|nr:DUF3265 domain-containing protein [Vibrio parahaemolyticus]MCG7792616.1 DUF3265 domain-containing protein [Vibrio parahaemolyticus]MCU8408809.1 DUF3265 domain-containing protein [Vibrio vulnificus]MDL2027509.1 DUF3265 domain-containing protein [Vibrio parahaemolyticus]
MVCGSIGVACFTP